MTRRIRSVRHMATVVEYPKDVNDLAARINLLCVEIWLCSLLLTILAGRPIRVIGWPLWAGPGLVGTLTMKSPRLGQRKITQMCVLLDYARRMS